MHDWLAYALDLWKACKHPRPRQRECRAQGWGRTNGANSRIRIGRKCFLVGALSIRRLWQHASLRHVGCEGAGSKRRRQASEEGFIVSLFLLARNTTETDQGRPRAESGHANRLYACSHQSTHNVSQKCVADRLLKGFRLHHVPAVSSEAHTAKTDLEHGPKAEKKERASR